ncbi:MAG TPA: DUF4091 domain-containing protein [Polyangiaceae bacterium]|nr:DUF4091 domain-containing protein [Polyangiaceae bacterium]
MRSPRPVVVVSRVAAAALAVAVAIGGPRAASAEDAGPEDAALGPAQPVTLRARVLDDGARVPGDTKTPLPESPFPGDAAELFALRGETVAFQVVVEPDGTARTLHATLGAFEGLGPVARVFAEHFVDVKRTSGNDKDDTSLAWTKQARPSPLLVGLYADALLPGKDAALGASTRAAFWIDLEVPLDATPGLYEARVLVSSRGGVVLDRAVRLRVAPQAMPWGALPVMVYYEPKNLTSRMGNRQAEPELRALLHAHHVASFHAVLTPADLEREIPYLTGEAYSPPAYSGPGQGKGEGIVVFGSYGDLGEPAVSKVPALAKMQARVTGLSSMPEAFLYAVDEDCKSPWPAAWRKLLDEAASLDGGADARTIRVGATCGTDPSKHAADVVMATPEDLEPERIAAARALGKVVWAYNGKRPFGGAMVMDAPAIDLRANGWIAARYGLPRWFYWEATSWTSEGGGKVGGATDPFVVADSFHNKDGDHSNGDGILVYPGTQVGGMTSFGEDTVYPSVRLKNLRRGVQDAGYILLARDRDAKATEAIVARMVPSALSKARGAASWSSDARPWLDARRELLALVMRAPADAVPRVTTLAPPAPPRPPRPKRVGAGAWAAIALCAAGFFAWGFAKTRPAPLVR